VVDEDLQRENERRPHKSVTVDSVVQDIVRAHIRVMVRTLLRRYQYPPDRQEFATQRVLKQAEAPSREWAE
jgi:type I restriction enzyme R subunit